MSARHVLHALGLTALSGCAHVAPTPTEPVCPPVPSPVSAPPVEASARDDARSTRVWVWKLRRSDASAWTSVPPTLHAFSLPHWECALGEALEAGTPSDGQSRRALSRKLACTHSSGLTVQSRLDCPLDEGSPSDGRELELSLDTLPALRLVCETVGGERGAPTLVSAP